jgi:hypothetical protein
VTQVTKVRGVIALAVLVSLAALVGASGPDKAKAKDSSASSTTTALPGFFRGR